MKIEQREISNQVKPYVIAELSANHNGSLEQALATVKATAQAGADALKLQTYRPDTITLNCDRPEFKIKGGLWDGWSLYDLYEEAHTPWEWHEELFKTGKESGVTVFSSPFDATAVEFLEKLATPAYKVASFEAMDLPLIELIAKTDKPIIISTGIVNKEQIAEALEVIAKNGKSEVALLHCVSDYPAQASQFNLKTIPDMIAEFKVPVGLSDHSLDNSMSIAAVGLGACIFEKHVILDRSAGGADSAFSLEPRELAGLCDGVQNAWKALGTVNYADSSPTGDYGRSLYFVRDVKQGAIIGEADIKSVRPGLGLLPKFYSEVIGRKALVDIKPCTPVAWDLLSN